MEAKNERAWNDVYDISQKPDYVHSYTSYYENIAKKNQIYEVSEYEKLAESMKIVILAIIDELIEDWGKLREAFIDKSVALGLTKRKDPKDFLFDYNAYFRKAVDNKLTGYLLDLKSATLDFKTAKKAKGGKEKQNQILASNWNKLVDFFIRALNFYEDQNNIWVTQYTGETEEQYKKRMTKKMPINMIESEIKKALAPLGLDTSDSKNIINILQKIKNNPNSISQEQKESIFINSYENQFAQAAGKLIEFSSFVDMKSDQIFSKMHSDQSDIRLPLGVQLSKLLVGDTLIGEVNYSGNNVKLLTSFKLRDQSSVSTSYNIVNDVLTMRTLKLAGDNSKLFNTISWIRRNLMSLSNFSVDEKKPNLDSFYEFEEQIALWSLIPRILDGVYTFQEEVLAPQFQNSRIHTALFFTKQKFFWMADILKELRSLIDNKDMYNVNKAIKKDGAVRNTSPVKKEDLESLYQQKRELIKKLAKQKIPINYNELYKIVSWASLNTNFEGWRPINSLAITVKYSVLI